MEYVLLPWLLSSGRNGQSDVVLISTSGTLIPWRNDDSVNFYYSPIGRL